MSLERTVLLRMSRALIVWLWMSLLLIVPLRISPLVIERAASATTGLERASATTPRVAATYDVVLRMRDPPWMSDATARCGSDCFTSFPARAVPLSPPVLARTSAGTQLSTPTGTASVYVVP